MPLDTMKQELARFRAGKLDVLFNVEVGCQACCVQAAVCVRVEPFAVCRYCVICRPVWSRAQPTLVCCFVVSTATED